MTDAGWGSKTRSGIVWTTASFLAGRTSTLVATLVLARLLAPADFGVVAAIVVFLAFVELVSDLGMKATVVFEQETGVSERVQTAFTLNLVLAVGLTALAVALAPAVAAFFGVPDEAGLFRLASVNLLIAGLGNIQDSLLLRELEFRRRIVPELVRSVLRGGVAIILALLGFGAESLVYGMLAGNAAWTMLLWVLTRFRPDFSLDLRIARSMFSYGSGAAFLAVLSVVTTRIDTVVVGRVLGPGPLGIYTIAFRVPELAIDSVTWNLSKVAFPALARMRARAGQGLDWATLELIRYQALYGLPVGVGLAILAPPLVVVLFGARWQDAGGVMSALAAASAIHAVVFPIGDALKAVGRQRLLASLQIAEFPILITAMVLSAPAGILAVAWVRAGMMVIHAGLMVAAGRHVIGIKAGRVLAAIAPALAAGAGVGLGAGPVRMLLPELSLLPLLAGTLAGAAGGLLALRVLAPGTGRDVARQFSRLREARAA